MAQHSRLPYLLIPLAALLAVLPLLVHGPSCGHDFVFHLLGWQDAALQISHGTLHPRWDLTAANGAGEPRFIFYPPLSWTLGALLTLAATHLALLLVHLPGSHGLSPLAAQGHAFALVPIAFIWLSLSTAGLAMLRLARHFVSEATATLAGVAYLANPYTLFTAYERAAFAELLAAAWFPLLLAALLPGRHRSRPLSLLGIALPLALLWLTNAPAAVIGSYLVLFLVSLRLLALLLPGRRSAPPIGSPARPLSAFPDRARAARSLALRAIAATALGLSLAAFYIVPAIHERPWVEIGMAVAPGLRPSENTLFHHTDQPFHDQVLHSASVLAVLLLAVTLAALLLRLWQCYRSAGSRPRSGLAVGDVLAAPLLVPLLLLTLAVAFFLTPPSLLLWRHLPELAFLQFPWRLLALLAPVAVLALSLLVPRLHLSPPALAAAALLLPSLLTLSSVKRFRQTCDAEDAPPALVNFVYDLTHGKNIHLLDDEPDDSPTDEYTPVTADNEALAPSNPPFFLLPESASDDAPPPPQAIPGPAPRSLDLTLPDPGEIVLNLREYPLYLVENNGKIVWNRIDRNDGLLSFPLPAGHNHLTITLATPPVERAATALSLAAAGLTAVLLLRRRGRVTHGKL